MNTQPGLMTLLLATLALGACNPEADATQKGSLSANEVLLIKHVQAQAAQIKELQAHQTQAALDAACSTSLICSLSHRIAGIAPPSTDAQPDPARFNFYITALRLTDTLGLGTFVAVLGLIWLLLQVLRDRLRLAQLETQIREGRRGYERLLGDIAELQSQRLTIEQAKRLASQSLQSALDNLIHRQEAIQAQKITKVRLEKDILAARKTLAQLNGLRGATQPSLTSPQATAKSIFHTPQDT